MHLSNPSNSLSYYTHFTLHLLHFLIRHHHVLLLCLILVSFTNGFTPLSNRYGAKKTYTDFSKDTYVRKFRLHSKERVRSENKHQFPFPNSIQNDQDHQGRKHQVSKRSITKNEALIQDEILVGSVFENPRALTIIALLFGVGIICALDRVAMSVALLPMASEFGYSETDKGMISAAFTVGYMLAMTPAGLLASFTSPSQVLAVGVGIWSIAQMLSPWAAFSSTSALLFARFCMGMAEATTTPTLQALVANWIPESTKAKVLCLLISGFQIGTVLAYQISPGLIDNLSWPGIFLAYGSVGFAWLLLWLPNASDNPPYELPEVADSTNGAAKDKIFKMPRKEEPKGLVQAFSEIPWMGFLKSKEVVALTVAHMAQNWGLYLLLSWLPTYFSRIYGEDLAASSTSSLYPFLAGIFMGNFGGIAADSLISGGYLSTTNCRKLFQTIACIGPAICMYYLAQVPETAEGAIVLFTAAGGLGALSSAGHASGAQDVAKKYTGTIYGVTSALAVFAGSIGTYVTGVLLDETGQFSTIFQITSIVYVIGAFWFATQFESRKVFE